MGLTTLHLVLVDRMNELAELDEVLVALAGGQRRHIAILELRHIRETLLPMPRDLARAH